MTKLTLKPREERRLLRGHAWAYRNEFESLPDIQDGEWVKVVSDRGKPVGTGYYQREGGIAVRLLDGAPSPPFTEWIADRLQLARALREKLFPGESVYRWIYAESDGIPGLIVDRYGSVAAVRAQSPFHDRLADSYVEALLKTEGLDGVLWTDASGKAREFGEVPSLVECTVNGLTVGVDLVGGQKTGLFLDQRDNWKLTAPWSPGARVLDAHCYAGLWSLHAARAGAVEILGVDTSAAAIEIARSNTERNGLAGTCRFECADVQEVLARGDKYDLVILDPPALVKSRKNLKRALGLYQALNRDAFKALQPGGVLITSTCSQLVDNDAFLEALKRAANSAQRQVRLLGMHGAAPDHPVLLAMPETRYLACAVLQAD